MNDPEAITAPFHDVIGTLNGCPEEALRRLSSACVADADPGYVWANGNAADGPSLRVNYVWLMMQLNIPESTSELLGLLESPDPRVRASVAYAILTRSDLIGNSGDRSRLLEETCDLIVKDKDVEVKRIVIRQLASTEFMGRSSERLVSIVKSALRDPDPPMRAMAIGCIERISSGMGLGVFAPTTPAEAREILTGLDIALSDQHVAYDMRLRAHGILVGLTGVHRTNQEASVYVRHLLENPSDPEVQQLFPELVRQ